MHVEHREIGPPKRTPSRGRAGMLARRRIENVRSAPGSVPDLGINLSVAGERVLFPLIPGHGPINARERPNQGLVERWPNPAGYRCARFRWPHAMPDPVGAVVELDGTDGRTPAKFLIDALHQHPSLFVARNSADDGPRLRLDPHPFLSQPALGWSQPHAAKPFARPLCSNRLPVCFRLAANRR